MKIFGSKILGVCLVLALAPVLGCTPQVEVSLPEKPIEININAKIDHDVRVRVERDVADLVNSEKGLF